jgi:hypothetical protein
MNEDWMSNDLDRQIVMTHERFAEAMAKRLPAMRVETKERYFATLSILVSRLADPEKPLRDVLQETMAEAAAMIFQELGSQ